MLQEILQDLKRKSIEPEELTDRIMFMSMFNDIDRTKKGNDEICISNAHKVKDYTIRFLQGHWTFPGPGSEKIWYGGSSYPPNGEWDSTANEMVQRFRDTGHPVFKIKSTSALSRGILKRKKGFETLQFNGDSSHTGLLFQTIRSVNQLSIYGAVATWSEQFDLTEEEKGRDNLSVNKSILTSALPPTMISGNSLQALSNKIKVFKTMGRRLV